MSNALERARYLLELLDDYHDKIFKNSKEHVEIC